MKRCLQCATAFTATAWTCPACAFTPAVQDGIPVFAPALAQAISGFENSFFATHGNEEAERSFWPQARSALLVWALQRNAPGARTFLEIGCGSGGVLAHFERALPEFNLVGAEALVEGLRMARRKLTRTHLMQFDASRIPYVDEFEVAGAFDVIEHIHDDQAVLASMVTALRPGGVLMLTVPQHPFLFGPADVYAKHERRYTASGLTAQVRQLGLTVECVTSFVSILFPLMAAARLLAKWRGGTYDISDEFKIGPLNSVFGWVMDIERWTIRHGMRWPFGGSLLVVARKAPA